MFLDWSEFKDLLENPLYEVSKLDVAYIPKRP